MYYQIYFCFCFSFLFLKFISFNRFYCTLSLFIPYIFFVRHLLFHAKLCTFFWWWIWREYEASRFCQDLQQSNRHWFSVDDYKLRTNNLVLQPIDVCRVVFIYKGFLICTMGVMLYRIEESFFHGALFLFIFFSATRIHFCLRCGVCFLFLLFLCNCW